jgi:signal transduction histidine kinase
MSSFPWKNTLLVTVAACLGLASLVVAATLSLRLQERITLVQGVRDLRRQVSLLGTALREAEAAQRMFVITGDEAHHAIFAGVRDAMPRRWEGLAEATQAVPGALPDLAGLQATADEALISLEETAAVRRSQGREAAMARVESGHSEKQLVAVHMELEALTEQLEQRTEEETRSLGLAEARGRAASVGAGLVALGVGALGVWQWWWSLRQYRRQIDLAAETRRAEQMARDKGDFLAAMSHEVRTPLNTILGMSDQLRAGLPAGPLGEQAAAVHTAARTMLQLVNDLLDLSRLEAGRLDLVCSAVSVASELDWLRRILGPQAEAAGVALEPSAAPDLPAVLWLDEGRFRQILLNLVGNGIKFTPHGGRVQMRLERSESARGPELVLEVKDTGIGIAPEAHARIFQPYVQGIGQQQGGPGQGAGLGLAIVRQLVGLMGGTISLQSRPGAGATFRVLLPLQEPPGSRFAPSTPAAAPLQAAPTPAASSRLAGASCAPLRGNQAARLRQILDDLYPAAVATHSTDDVKRLADALAELGAASGCPALAEEAARLESASTAFALTELSGALDSLASRLAPLAAPR